MASNLKEERTLLLIKPDGVKRGLIGDVINRIEKRGLKIIALKMVAPSREEIKKNYPGTDEWLMGLGNKTLDNYEKYGLDALKEMGTTDTKKMGLKILEWLLDYMTSGPVVAIMISGLHAVDMVRKIVGNTLPNKADMGTIRGDYSVDSSTLANAEKRAIKNVVHASGNVAEAEHELNLWFKKEDIHFYKRAEEDIMF